LQAAPYAEIRIFIDKTAGFQKGDDPFAGSKERGPLFDR
jgi:hypothetical protein